MEGKAHDSRNFHGANSQDYHRQTTPALTPKDQWLVICGPEKEVAIRRCPCITPAAATRTGAAAGDRRGMAMGGEAGVGDSPSEKY